MGHYIQGFVAPEGPLRDFASRYQHAYVIPLAHDFAFLPVIDEFFDELSEGTRCNVPYLEFWKLSAGLIRFADAVSRAAPIAYIETDYFGGAGTQSAMAWDRGLILFAPCKTGTETPLCSGAINQALRAVGVARPVQTASGRLGAGVRRMLQILKLDRLRIIDEYDLIKLGRFRDNDDFIEFITS